MPQPSVLIEKWLPIAEVGVESMRERGASSALPPLYFLHVWWARRPLIASRAAILASVLPQWSADWPEALHQKFPTEEIYHQWFTFLLGIRGDPVKAYKLLQWARQEGRKIPNPYTAGRAFTINPSCDDLQTMGDLLEYTWGTRQISMLDPFAGGGSIPFEALRYGFTTYANDLNPVAATILKATLEYPARFGPALTDDIRKWGKRWYELVKPKLEPYFTPLPKDAEGAAYLWARTVQWRGRTVPLCPIWCLSTGDNPVAVRLIADPEANEPRFEILEGRQIGDYDPEQGTISRGVARCPWTNDTIAGDYIKAEAQAGRLRQFLYAVALKKRGGFDFRAPTQSDYDRVRKAEQYVIDKRNEWLAKNIIPNEVFPEGNDNRPIQYGMKNWIDFLSPRQLLTIGTYMEVFRDLEKEIYAHEDKEKANGLITYLGFALDKCPNYNSRLSVWHPARESMANTFNRHDFSFSWSHGEFDGAGNLLPWAVSQIEDAYKELAKLISPSQETFFEVNKIKPYENLCVFKRTASNLLEIKSSSIESITVDPPYYDNVQYAELSDFFYVWLKRSVGHLFPDFFTDELTNKDDEAVANPARFSSLA